MADPRLLHLVGQLAVLGTRAEVARALAEAVGAEDLLLFVRDRQLDRLLPAPGFPQTLRRGAEWRAFLATCVEQGTSVGTMPSPQRDADADAWGYRVGDDNVLVLLGRSPDHVGVREILPLFTLVGAIAVSEDAMRVLEAKAQLATQATSQAQVLTSALERSRDQIRDALTAARESQRLVEEQTEELSAAAERLEQSSEELAVMNEELLSANEQLRQSYADADRARASAEEANHTKAGFLAMMSHELRTPLNAIGGYAALLEEEIMGPLVPGQREYLARIKRSQVHLSALINDVLNFAKTESGTITYHIQRLELRHVLASVTPLIEPMAQARKVRYEYVAATRDVDVDGDRDKIVQVVLNLLTNAVKFTPPNGIVRLSTAMGSNKALIAVSDSGPGIPADQRASIFEPFVQLERSFTQEREGVGLGLSISRELARRMGGDVVVESVVGCGSTFTFSLPLSAERAEGTTVDAEEHPLARSASELGASTSH